jgi:hypothetical protein
MSWLSTLFSGDKTATNASNSLINTGNVATNAGLSDTTSASKFFQGILNGNYSSLAPAISGIQKQGSQSLQTLSQFGNRSGGTNAKAQTAQDTTRSSINDLIAQLTGTAASNLGSLGSSLLNTGTSATTSGAGISLQNKSLVDQLLNSVGSGVGAGLVKWATN